MQGAVLHGPRDVRFEKRETPKIIQPTDAIIRISAACICGKIPMDGINDAWSKIIAKQARYRFVMDVGMKA